MSIRKRCSWYLFPWVLAGGFFVFAPLGVAGVFFSPLVALRRKLFFLLFLFLFLFGLSHFSAYFRKFEYHRLMKRYSEEKNAFRYEKALEILQGLNPDGELSGLELLLEKNSLYNSLGRKEAADLSFGEARELFLRIFATEFPDLNIKGDFSELINDFLVRKLFFPPVKNPENTMVQELMSLHLPILLRIALLSGKEAEASELLLKAYQLCAFPASGFGRNTVEFYLLFYLTEFLPERIPEFENGWGKSLLSEVQTYAGSSPYNLTAYYLRAMVREIAGDYQGARRDFLHVFMLDTRFFAVLERIKKIDSRLRLPATDFLEKYLESEDKRFFNGDFQASLQLSESLLERLEEDSEFGVFEEEILFNMGVIYRNNTREYEKAAQVFARIVDLGSFRKEEALYNLIMSGLSLGRFAECEIYLRELLYRFPQTRHRKRLLIIRFYLQARAAFMDFVDRMKK